MLTRRFSKTLRKTRRLIVARRVDRLLYVKIDSTRRFFERAFRRVSLRFAPFAAFRRLSRRSPRMILWCMPWATP
jgi:hypothetical protein